jgi:hypothetical protein
MLVDFNCVALFYYRRSGDYSTQMDDSLSTVFDDGGAIVCRRQSLPMVSCKFLVFLFFIRLDLFHNGNRRGLDHVVVVHHGQDVSVVALAGRYNAGTAMG